MGVPLVHPALPGTKDSAKLDLGQLPKDLHVPAVPWPGLGSLAESETLSLRPVCLLSF